MKPFVAFHIAVLAVLTLATAAPRNAFAQDAETRSRVGELISQLAGEDMGSRLRAKGACEELVRIGRPAVPPLIEALKSLDTYARVWAVGALGQIGDPRARRPMIPLLKDPKPVVRQVAVWHCRRWIDDPQILQGVLAGLEDPVPEVRSWARRALKETRKNLYVERMKKLTESPSADVRAEAVDELKESLPPDAYKEILLGRVERDPDAKIRSQALEQLEGALSESAYGEVMIGRLAKDGDVKIRTKALVFVLKREDLKDQAIPILIGWLERLPDGWAQEQKAKVQKVALKALDQLTGSPFAASPPPLDESPAAAAARWKQWWESQKSQQSPRK